MNIAANTKAIITGMGAIASAIVTYISSSGHQSPGDLTTLAGVIGVITTIGVWLARNEPAIEKIVTDVDGKHWAQAVKDTEAVIEPTVAAPTAESTPPVTVPSVPPVA